MEGAEPQVIGAALLQLHVARDDVDDVDAIEQILLERIRYHFLAPIFPRKGWRGAAFLAGETRLYERGDLAHVRLAGEPRLERAHDLAHVLRARRAGLGDR